MPLGVKGGDVVLHDGPVASATFGSEHVEVVVPAIGLSFAFMEAVFPKLLSTLGAEEVLHMPGLLQSSHAFLKHKNNRKIRERTEEFFEETYVQDRAVAVSASRAEEVVVVGLAVGLSIALEEVPRAQLLGAVGAREVLRMPGFAQGSNDLTNDGFFAGVAAAFLAGIDSLATHVSLEVTEHGIQVLFGRRCRLRLGCLGGSRVRRVCHCLMLRTA